MPNDVDGPDVVWRGLNAVMTVAEVTTTVGRPPLCTGKDCAMTTHRRGRARPVRHCLISVN
jgi:hypothetical protein